MLRISPRHGRGSNAIACCLNGSAIVRTLLFGFSSLPKAKKQPSLLGRLLFFGGEGGVDSMLRISPRQGRGSNAIACCLNGSAIVRTLLFGFSSLPVVNADEWKQKKPQCFAEAFLYAEREGFEPSVRINAQRFSRPPDSTTLAPLRFVQRRRRLLPLSFRDRRGI